MDKFNVKSRKKSGFTIVELLTVMSIIVILIGLLVPGLNKVRRYAKKVKQKSQFHGIANGIELFNAEQGDYPPSSFDDTGTFNYCGAMKLAEAMVGKDFLGFNPKSNFEAGESEYYFPDTGLTDEDEDSWNKTGRTQYLELEASNANYLGDLYGYAGASDTGNYDPCDVVLCDVYSHDAAEGDKGMPVLYYRADTSGTTHPNPQATTPIAYDAATNIYDYNDNDDFVALEPFHTPMPTGTAQGTVDLTLEDNRAEIFYEQTWNDKVQIDDGRPYRSDSFILLSAGFDGVYFTGDDIYNFQKNE